MEVSPERIWKRIHKIAEIGDNGQGGINRYAYSDEETKTLDLVMTWMRDIGLNVWRDSVGNVFGRLDGSEEGPAMLTGSHLDSVPDGGKYDGIVGVVGALEVTQIIKEQRIPHRQPVEMVIFVNEEGSRFPGGLMGSMAIAGKLPKDFPFYVTDRQGVTLAEAMKKAGLEPESIEKAKRTDIGKFFELHIEQANVLETSGCPIGIVTSIAGPYQMELKICGQTGHAGAMPMGDRKNPMVAASMIIQEVERSAIEASNTTRGTVGYLHVQPGGHNVIPAYVEMTLDYRDTNTASRESAIKRIKQYIETICLERGLAYELTVTQDAPPIIIREVIISLLAEQAKKHHIPYRKIVSGAAHDAMVMAHICDVGMIFVRSQQGLSHCKDEFSARDDIARATEVLYHSIVNELQKEQSLRFTNTR